MSSKPRRLVRSSYLTAPHDVCEGMTIDRVLDGLRESKMEQAVKLVCHRTLNEAITQALEFEPVKQSERGQASACAATAEPSKKPYRIEDLVQKFVDALKTGGGSCTAGTIQN